MKRWNENNTDGFSAAELDVLNEAQERLEAEYPGIDPQNISDRLNNAILPNMTADDLVAAASL